MHDKCILLLLLIQMNVCCRNSNIKKKKQGISNELEDAVMSLLCVVALNNVSCLVITQVLCHEQSVYSVSVVNYFSV